MLNTKTLTEKKTAALTIYKAAKAAYLEDQSKENWITFCNARRTCMLLGVRI